MAKSPKKEEYKASESEKANASIAAAEQDYFQETYAPLLRQMRDKASGAQDKYTDVLQDRAQADSMQALTGGRPNLAVVQGVDYAANMASGAVGQQLQARMKGKDIATNMQANVLGTARGQQSDAATGLGAASRMATSSLLSAARDKQSVRSARAGALASTAGTFLGQMGENSADTDSYWKKPGKITQQGSAENNYKQTRGPSQNVFASIFGGG
jgi:hypothetical protein